ncbi:tyrosine-protein phosphatase [Foetidibacter luteolus]|uniref:tyrosine-protein phosphatase n=1 Tax=Foetidibacter luteolus TaxID=2608880 RepID=UPI00129BDA32|nr:CpsB/CapC family capsule biosynthesis tyrosine phosphatase [Foetidibacter luteolus]
MLSFLFKKKENIKPDLSFIGVDMHSHLLPGLDDGLQTMEDTLLFMERLQQLGYRKLICTPHILSDLYPNSPGTILPRLDEVKKAVAARGLAIEVAAGAEYMVDMEMENYLRDKKQMLSFGNKNVLIEMSYLAESPNIEQVIFEMRMQGYQPILAHPERYNFYHQRFEQYQRFIDLGCLMQVNLLSLLGYYGKPIKMVAEKLARNKMIDLLGTDMHHEKHLAALEELATRKEFYTLAEGLDIKNSKLFGSL